MNERSLSLLGRAASGRAGWAGSNSPSASGARSSNRCVRFIVCPSIASVHPIGSARSPARICAPLLACPEVSQNSPSVARLHETIFRLRPGWRNQLPSDFVVGGYGAFVGPRNPGAVPPAKEVWGTADGAPASFQPCACCTGPRPCRPITRRAQARVRFAGVLTSVRGVAASASASHPERLLSPDTFLRRADPLKLKRHRTSPANARNAMRVR